LRFSRSEKSDGCPIAKLPSDAKHRFAHLPKNFPKKAIIHFQQSFWGSEKAVGGNLRQFRFL